MSLIHDQYETTLRDNARLETDLATLRERLADTHKTVDRVWCALGIATYDDAGGKEISTIVADWKARAEAAEARVKQIRAETIEECAKVCQDEAEKVADTNADRYWQSKRIEGSIRALASETAGGGGE